MAVQYKDYYKDLGVSKEASQEEIKKAFRDLAKKYHPDRTRGDKEAEKRFKEINEAYEILGDPKRRENYDMLGSGYREGQEFRPPPGWEDIFSGAGRGGGASFQWPNGEGGAGAGGFSDFFNILRGFSGGGGMGEGGDPFGAMGGMGGMGGGGQTRQQRTADVETTMTITLEEAVKGGSKKVSIARQSKDPSGQSRTTRQVYDIKIPSGIRDGKKIRLKGEGSKIGGRTGDLLIKVKIQPHSLFRVEGDNLVADLVVAPWEAALGGKISVSTPEGKMDLKLPPGTSSGQRLRVSGKGLPGKGDAPQGDLFYRVKITVPKKLTAQEKEMFEKLAKVSRFKPRS